MADRFEALYLGSIFNKKKTPPCCPLVVIQNSDTVTATGLGTEGDPFILTAAGGGGGSVITEDSDSIDFTGDGTSGSPLSASVNISANGGNIITAESDGIFATYDPTDPAGPTNAIQFNNAGAFGGSAGLIWDDGASTLTIPGTLAGSGNLALSGDGEINLMLSQFGPGVVANPFDSGYPDPTLWFANNGWPGGNPNGNSYGYIQGNHLGFLLYNTQPGWVHIFQVAGSNVLTIDPTGISTTLVGATTVNLQNISLPVTPVNGNLETDGTNLYFTVGGVRKTVTLT